MDTALASIFGNEDVGGVTPPSDRLPLLGTVTTGQQPDSYIVLPDVG